jgi:hypothetical protein
MGLLTKLIPAGFSVVKMLKKSGKVGGTTAAAVATVSTQIPEVSTGSAFWLGLASAVLTAVANYLAQVVRKK